MVIVGCEDVEQLKPSPQPVLLALRLLNVETSGVWMIGDTRTDMRDTVWAAWRSGAGVGTPAHAAAISAAIAAVQAQAARP